MGVAVLAGEIAENSSLNDQIRDSVYEVDHLSSGTSDFLKIAGEGYVLLGLGASLYGLGLATRSPRHYLAGRTAMASMTATGILTLGLKVAINDRRPNGGDYAYPSGHTSMSVALATSIHSSYGWKASAPLYLLSGLVAFQRVDSGAHELDDILVGAALGFLVSREVHGQRSLSFLGGDVDIHYDPQQGGVALGLQWNL